MGTYFIILHIMYKRVYVMYMIWGKVSFNFEYVLNSDKYINDVLGIIQLTQRKTQSLQNIKNSIYMNMFVMLSMIMIITFNYHFHSLHYIFNNIISAIHRVFCIQAQDLCICFDIKVQGYLCIVLFTFDWNFQNSIYLQECMKLNLVVEEHLYDNPSI